MRNETEEGTLEQLVRTYRRAQSSALQVQALELLRNECAVRLEMLRCGKRP